MDTSISIFEDESQQSLEVGEIGLFTSSRCLLETRLQSWPTQRRTLTRPIDQRYRARFSNVHRLLSEGL
jgi:hypothetical protein